MKTLRIKQFGRFHNVNFDIAPLTIFFGSNEAGKTTIADAIFEGLCQPDRRRAHGKRLTSRYGKGFDSSISSGNDIIAETIPEEEYLNLFAIHSSDLTFAIDEKSSWTEVLRDRLYGGAVSCQNIIDTLTAKGEDDRRRDHNKKLLTLESRRQQLKEKIAILVIDQKKINDTIQTLHETGTQLDTINKQSAELNEQITNAQSEVERLRDWTNFNRVSHASKLLYELRTLTLECKDIDLQSFRQSVAHTKETKANLANNEILLAHLQDRRRNVKSSLAENEQHRLQERSKASNRIEVKVNEHTEHLNQLLKRRSIITPGSVGCAFIAAASLLFFLTNQRLIDSTVLGLSLNLGLLVLGLSLIGFQVRQRSAWQSRLRFTTVGDLIDDWNSFTIDYSGEEVRKLPVDLKGSEYKAYLDQLSPKVDIDSPLGSQLKRQELKLRSELDQLDEKLQLESQRQADLQEQLIKCCNQVGVDSLGQAETVLQQQTIKQSRLTHLTDECTRLNLLGSQAQTDIDRHMRFFEDNPPAGPEPSDPNSSLAEASKRLQHLEREQQLCSERLLETKGKNEGLSGEVRGRLRDLPSRMVDLEIELSELDTAIAAAQTEKLGARIAADIFTEIGKSTAEQFEKLASEVTRLLDPILPNAAIEISDLKSKTLSVTDHGGALRPMKHLSSGTQDLYALGCRLALAACTGRQSAILTLDDPFVFFDNDRQIAALKIIANLVTENNWNGVLLTKDRELVRQAQQVWQGCLVHDLDVRPAQLKAPVTQEVPPKKMTAQKLKAQDRKPNSRKKKNTALQRCSRVNEDIDQLS